MCALQAMDSLQRAGTRNNCNRHINLMPNGKDFPMLKFLSRDRLPILYCGAVALAAAGAFAQEGARPSLNNSWIAFLLALCMITADLLSFA